MSYNSVVAVLNCKYFTGYKPCGRSETCDDSCSQKVIPQVSLLIVHLEAIGAVLRATSILPAIKRKFPSSHVTWVTKTPSHQLLKGNSMIDRVLTTSSEDLLQLSALAFDIGFVVDKSLSAFGVIQNTQVDMIYGFMVDRPTGSIIPATSAADELWQIGLSDQKKFYENQKAETQLMIEALELGPFRRDEYQVQLSDAEKSQAIRRNQEWSPKSAPVIGINTGCSSVIPYKKFSVEFHRRLIKSLKSKFNLPIVLLGGPEDQQRNSQIAAGLDVVESPTTSGLRDGLTSVAACDVVISGDSLGMHMAIAMKKWIVAWFGPTCAQEIDLYDRGIKLQSPVSCAPCWKRHCQKQPLCGDMVEEQQIIQAVEKGLLWHTNRSSSKQHSSEIFS